MVHEWYSICVGEVWEVLLHVEQCVDVVGCGYDVGNELLDSCVHSW